MDIYKCPKMKKIKKCFWKKFKKLWSRNSLFLSKFIICDHNFFGLFCHEKGGEDTLFFLTHRFRGPDHARSAAQKSRGEIRTRKYNIFWSLFSDPPARTCKMVCARANSAGKSALDNTTLFSDLRRAP